MGNLPVLSRGPCNMLQNENFWECSVSTMNMRGEPFAKVGTAVKCLKRRFSEHKHSSISLQFTPTLTLLQNIYTSTLILKKKRLRNARRNKLSKTEPGQRCNHTGRCGTKSPHVVLSFVSTTTTIGTGKLWNIPCDRIKQTKKLEWAASLFLCWK